MKTVVIIRAETEKRKKYVAELMNILNSNVNSVSADIVSMDDYPCNGEMAAASRSCKNAFKLLMGNTRHIVVVNNNSLARKDWKSYFDMAKSYYGAVEAIAVDLIEPKSEQLKKDATILEGSPSEVAFKILHG